MTEALVCNRCGKVISISRAEGAYEIINSYGGSYYLCFKCYDIKKEEAQRTLELIRAKYELIKSVRKLVEAAKWKKNANMRSQ